MNFWNALIYSAAVLLATAFFYVVVRWRRSPMAIKGMAFVATLCFVAGVLSGIWFFHLTAPRSESAATATPTKSPPAPSPSPSSTRAATATTEPTAQPTPRPTPSIAAKATTRAPGVPTHWLAKVNYYRALAKVPPVAEDEKLSTGDRLHARYLVKNRVPPDARAHDEDPANPWFTSEGLAAARASDVIAPCAGCAELSAAHAMDMWIAGPFHRVSVLNPALTRIGYGEFRENGLNAYAINLGAASPKAGRFAAPIVFPGDGTVVALKDFNGEWPDPLAACPGFRYPSGLPVTLQLGMHVEAVIEQHRFSEDGRALDHCVFDASSYANPDASAQPWGRNILKGFSVVVLIPRAPLTAGHRYTVDVRVSGQSFRWSFSIAR